VYRSPGSFFGHRFFPHRWDGWTGVLRAVRMAAYRSSR
jgi:hypothetical protein